MKRTIMAAMVLSLAVGSLALADPPQDHDRDHHEDRHHMVGHHEMRDEHGMHNEHGMRDEHARREVHHGPIRATAWVLQALLAPR